MSGKQVRLSATWEVDVGAVRFRQKEEVDMLEGLMEGMLLGAVFVVPFLLIWMLDRRSKTKGPLFSGEATPIKRIVSLLGGLLILWATIIWPAFNGSTILFSVWLWLLAVALLAYAIGFRRILDQVQGVSLKRNDSDADEP